MKYLMITASGLLLPLLMAAAPANAQAARNYDCTKAGNANKAACKGAATVAPPAAKPAAAAKAPAPRIYDCSKAGNANKAVCKNAAAPVATARPAAPVAPAPRPAPAAAPAPVTRAAPATAAVRGGDKPTNPGGPNGATAQCKDGTYSKSTHHSGTCAGHKGVATWY